MTDIRGSVAPGFEPVRDAFESNFARHGDVGAGVAVYHQGELMVDLTGGSAADGPYDETTLQLVFSTTKGAAAACVAILVDRGQIDPAAPVGNYWAEFAAGGKDEVTVEQMLSHRAGIPAVDSMLSIDQICAVGPVVEALAAQAPLWEPGSTHGYHALTYGWLAGELVRRVDGRSIGAFFADEVATPLGLDFWIGLPESEEARVAPLIPGDPPTDPAEIARDAPGRRPGHVGVPGVVHERSVDRPG